jgi:glycosyltransferase involved in cell wall biosynthesis
VRVAFITNRAPHYRLPIFLRLSERWKVDFLFTAVKPGRWWTEHQRENREQLICQTGVTPRQTFHAIRKGHYDCVILSLGGRAHLLAAAVALALRRPVPLVLWVDMWKYPSSIPHLIGKVVVRYLVCRANALVVCGAHMKTWIAAEFGRKGQVYVMPNAIEISSFGATLPQEQASRLREDLALDDAPVAGFVGRFEVEKGLPNLLHAFAACDADLSLVLVGEGSQRPALEAIARDLNLTSRVRMLGWVRQEELPALYQAFDFVVMPSITTPLVKETWGVVANEAMAAGLPVIATDAVGAAAGGLVVDRVTGLVVAESDRGSLAAALSALARDEELRRQLGAAAVSRVQRFTFDGAAEAFERAVRRAVATRGDRGSARLDLEDARGA